MIAGHFPKTGTTRLALINDGERHHHEENLADGEGFEPPVQFPTRRFSNLVLHVKNWGETHAVLHSFHRVAPILTDTYHQ